MKSTLLAVSLVLMCSSAGQASLAAETSPRATAPNSNSSASDSTGDDWSVGKSAKPPEKESSQVQPAARPRPAQLAASPARPVEKQPATSSATTRATDGQWVFTQQYGWVWIPYDRSYTYIGPEDYPYSYIYYPTVGWCWLYSPWIYGWGPGPYWGPYGRVHFAWYARPWFSRPIYRGGYWGGYRGGGYWGGGYRGYHGGGFRGGGGGFRGGGRGHR